MMRHLRRAAPAAIQGIYGVTKEGAGKLSALKFQKMKKSHGLRTRREIGVTFVSIDELKASIPPRIIVRLGHQFNMNKYGAGPCMKKSRRTLAKGQLNGCAERNRRVV